MKLENEIVLFNLLFNWGCHIFWVCCDLRRKLWYPQLICLFFLTKSVVTIPYLSFDLIADRLRLFHKIRPVNFCDTNITLFSTRPGEEYSPEGTSSLKSSYCGMASQFTASTSPICVPYIAVGFNLMCGLVWEKIGGQETQKSLSFNRQQKWFKSLRSGQRSSPRSGSHPFPRWVRRGQTRSRGLCQRGFRGKPLSRITYFERFVFQQWATGGDPLLPFSEGSRPHWRPRCTARHKQRPFSSRFLRAYSTRRPKAVCPYPANPCVESPYKKPRVDVLVGRGGRHLWAAKFLVHEESEDYGRNPSIC